MGTNKNPRQIVDGKLRCGSKYHEGDRMVLLEEFPTKVTSPDGYDYTCKRCHSKYNKSRGQSGYHAWKARYPARALIVSRRSEARKQGIEFTITEEDVIIPDVCPVLGIPLKVNVSGGGPSYNAPSLDRIDNTKGYIPGNVVVVSWRANTLKKDASIKELINLADFYKQYLTEEMNYVEHS